jgi:galactokinase
MTGGGFGGSTITLIDARRVPALRAAIKDAFAAARLAAPRISVVTPSAGARKEA